MKKLTFSILSLLLLGGMATSASAQTTDAAPATNARYFSVGPLLTFGASTMAGDVAEGFKIRPKLTWQFGVLSEVDISEAISFDLGLTYENRTRYWYTEADEDAANYTVDVSSLTISPLFSFRHFLLGFGIRLPMSGTLITDGPLTDNKNHELPSVAYPGLDLKTAIDIKIGGNIEILETRGGTLNFIVLAGYDLTPGFKEIKEPAFNPGQPEGSLHLGINYLFNAAELK